VPDGRVGEVISVVARRRRWTLEQKLALMEEVSRPGASVAAVADGHGMSRSLLFQWRRQIREGTMAGVVHAEMPSSLVPVRVVEDSSAPVPDERHRPVPPQRKTAGRPGKATATIEVVLSNGWVLRVSEAIRPELLGLLATALDT
jgi:transposase